MLPNKENEQLWREMQDQTRPNLTPLELETIVEKAKEDKTKNSIRTNEELIFPKKKKK